MVSDISLKEFSKTYKKLKKNDNDDACAQMDDTLDQLNVYMHMMMSKEHTPSCNLSRDEFIENKLWETVCVCSVLFAIEYDARYN